MDDNVTYEPLELNQHSGEFACPACGVRSRFRIIGTIKVRDIEQVGAEEIAERVPIASTAAAEAMKAAGVWDAFRQAIDKLQIKPKYPEDFADVWLRTAVVLKKIRPEVMRYVFEEFGYGKVAIWGSNTICAIVVDDVLRTFIPRSLINGEAFYQLTEAGGQITQTKVEMSLPIWIRTKWGYVAHGKGALFSELRRKSAGDFQVK